MSTQPDIFYTLTDEAPALATASLLPIIQHFAGAAGVTIEATDISLAGRIIANFPDNLRDDQKIPKAMDELGKLVNEPHANIIKLPNISASIPQLQAAIKELQEQGYDIPDYPEEPEGSDEKFLQKRYSAILGSAVNPVLRQGNADRRPIPAAKAYAKINPPQNAPWTTESQTHVAHMNEGDFFNNEQSTTVHDAGNVMIEFIPHDGKDTTILNPRVKLEADEVIDSTLMSVKALRSFIKQEMQDAKDKGILFSVHLKATMMKVSDPEMFGHVVEVFFEDVFTKHADLFDELGVNSNNGISDVYTKIKGHEKEAEVLADIETALADGPELMMVKHKDEITDETVFVTNLHLPNKVIIDASVPPIMRWGGKTRSPDGEEHDVKIVIPDSTYAVFHRAMAEDSRENGTFDPKTTGSVFNIGLMAQKAEEYGSHDKTYMAESAGTIRVVDENDNIIHSHEVEAGDIWRMCQAKDAPIKNWVELAVSRSHITGAPSVFWLDENRPHDAELIKKVEAHLKTLDTDGLEIQIMAPLDAAKYTNKLVREGKNVNAITGNVLRDHVTDMYPILELGTSAKMVSIVPEMAGGAMFETGAGGSAPDQIVQVEQASHLRWDSLGEFAAIAASFDELGRSTDNEKASILGTTLDNATTRLLNEGKSPSRKTGELDNKGSHFYLAMYWAEELATQEDNAELSEYFVPLAQTLKDNEAKIVEELMAVEGQEADLGGYYHTDPEKVAAVMRPSPTLNRALTPTG